MRKNLLKGSASAVLGAISWLANRLWGDSFFNWLQPMIPAWVSNPPANGALQFLLSYGPPIGFFCLAVYFFILWKKEAKKSPLPQTKTRFDLLAERMGENTFEPGLAHIVYFDNRDRTLADSIAAIFEMCQWETNYTKVPQGMHNPHHIEGIIIGGFNKYFIEKIAGAFKEAGFTNILVELKELKLPKENPKWLRAQRRVDITIGYQ